MTYIEFFDKIASENISACLTYTPDRVIYIGDSKKQMNKHMAYYRRVFADRGVNIDFSCRTVSKSNLESAVKVLTDLVEEYDDCVFDITGGEEILTLALGVVYAQNPGKNIQIHKFNLRNNTLYDCDKDGVTVYRDTPTLSVVEQVRIYGGDVLWGGLMEEKTCRWDLSGDFLGDIETMWQICRENVRKWNTQIGVLDAVCKVGQISEDGLSASTDISSVDTQLAQYRTDYRVIRSVLVPLLRAGLLTGYEEDGFTVSVSFKNMQIRKCLTKAGLALELKIYAEALALTDDSGEKLYDDAVNGVVIDWDGEGDDEFGTENEVDILLMHDMVPVFISCKNGYVTTDELYKLNTVAERFGGGYGKKILVATALETMGDAANYLRRRAKDMNIRLIDDLQDLSEEDLQKRMRTLWSS